MDKELEFLVKEGIRSELVTRIERFRRDEAESTTANVPAHIKNDASAPIPSDLQERIPSPEYHYYGKAIWEKAIAAILCGKNLLLTGPKATGKNVLAQNLSCVFARPQWDVSFHVDADAASLIGSDSYDGERVVFRPGPIWMCAKYGGFGVLDEINMARNEALAVLHAALDFRHCIDVPGYERIPVSDKTRFIATMNYGYSGTRDLNEALTSRFVVLEMPVIDKEDLAKLMTERFPALREQMLDQFIRLFFELAEKAESTEISDRACDLRGLIDAIDLMSQGIPSGEALDMCLTNKTFDPYERTLIRDVIRSRIPADLTERELFA